MKWKCCDKNSVKGIVAPFPTESTIDQYRKNEVKTLYYVRTEDLYQTFTVSLVIIQKTATRFFMKRTYFYIREGILFQKTFISRYGLILMLL